MINAPLPHRLIRAAQCSRFHLQTLALVVVALSATSAVEAQLPMLPPEVIKVEEDWELDVATPDPAANVPQVVCVFGPADPETDTHAVFEINHGTAPDFMPGGMQLQCWWRDSLLGYGNHPNNREFDAAVDQITFTTNTELADGRLVLEVTNGNSVNWGTFGDQGYLRLWLNTSRTDLNNYNSAHSVEHSRIAYGKHRANRFVRTEVRYYTALGLVHTETEDAIIFTQVSTAGE